MSVAEYLQFVNSNSVYHYDRRWKFQGQMWFGGVVVRASDL